MLPRHTYKYVVDAQQGLHVESDGESRTKNVCIRSTTQVLHLYIYTLTENNS